MDFLRNLFGRKRSAPPEEITEAQKAAIQKLLGDLGNEFDIEGRIKASEELGGLRNFGEADVVSALTSAAKKAVMQWDVKRMTMAARHGVRPEQIDVRPHADDSRVTIAAAKALRKLANRKDETGKKSKAALEDIRKSIRSTELSRKITETNHTAGRAAVAAQASVSWRSTCSKCGKRGEPLRKGARIMLGTMDALSGRIMQCPACSRLFCGSCAAVVNRHGYAFYQCPSCNVAVQPLQAQNSSV
jgi:hypothetical protein